MSGGLILREFGGAGPLLVVGPSLGTSVSALWSMCAARLTDRFRILGWELPGHGGAPDAHVGCLEDVARDVAAAVDRSARGEEFVYAGVSIGGAVGAHLVLAEPQRVTSAVLLCTGARIGTPTGWRDRAAAVRTRGTRALVPDAPTRWFAAGFADAHPDVVAGLLADLMAADDESYASLAEALAGHDITEDLHRIAVPVLAVAGDEDPVTGPVALRHIAEGVPDGRLVVLPGVSHLAPAEAPHDVARLIREHADRPPRASPTIREVRARGMRTRRNVLGHDHVDRAQAATTDLTAAFQDYITTAAWGSVWDRPGLSRRDRSIATLIALLAGGHHAELAMHLRAALSNGLTREEVVEVLLHGAVYCGVPAAHAAFRVADEVLGSGDEGTPPAR